MKLDDLPFPRGTTFPFYSDDVGATPDLTAGAQYEGQEFLVEDVDYSNGRVNGVRSGKRVTLRVVRNKTATAVLPKRVVKYKVDGSTSDVYGGQINGYNEAVGFRGGVVDEFLPAAGVPVGYLHYIVVAGPTKLTSGASGDTTFAIDAIVVPTTDGKVVEADAVSVAVAGTSEAQIEAGILAAFNQITGFHARACEAVSAINTDFMAIVNRNLW